MSGEVELDISRVANTYSNIVPSKSLAPTDLSVVNLRSAQTPNRYVDANLLFSKVYFEVSSELNLLLRDSDLTPFDAKKSLLEFRKFYYDMQNIELVMGAENLNNLFACVFPNIQEPSYSNNKPFCGRPVEDLDIVDYVNSSVCSLAKIHTDYLIKMGHIVNRFVGTTKSNQTIAEKVDGFNLKVQKYYTLKDLCNLAQNNLHPELKDHPMITVNN